MKTKAKLFVMLKIWVVIYPSMMLFLSLFGKLLSALPLYQRTLLLTVLLVPWVVIAVPLLDALIYLVSAKRAKK